MADVADRFGMRVVSVGICLWGLGCTPSAPAESAAAAPTPSASEVVQPAEPSRTSTATSSSTAADAAEAEPGPSSAAPASAAPVAAAPDAASTPRGPAPSELPPYQVPQRTAEEVAAELRGACEAAKQHQRPVLLEFGASWCKDCRRVGSLARIEPLATELAQWQRVEVNITDPDPHEALLGSFGVRAIAHWEALVPTQCEVAPGRWKRIGNRTVEPKRADVATAEQLTQWLTAQRKRAAAAR